MSRVVLALVLLSFVICSGAGTASAQQYPNMNLTLTGMPESYQGPCPVVIRFKGTINTNLPGRIHYKFVRSDGTYSPREVAQFETSGSQDVTANWTVGTAEQSRYEGFMILKAVYPGESESPRARFKVTCTGMAVDLPDLTIEDITLDDQCRVVVKGKNIGPGPVFDAVWTDHKPDSPGIKLYVDGKAWGSEAIWLLDPHKDLRNPGGTVVFSSNLRVTGTQEIRVTIDGTRQVREKDETNNERKITLTCNLPGLEKQP